MGILTSKEFFSVLWTLSSKHLRFLFPLLLWIDFLFSFSFLEMYRFCLLDVGRVALSCAAMI